MTRIDFKNGDHEIQWQSTPEQDELIRAYRQPLRVKLAEEQAARYRKDPDKYRALSSVASLLDEGIYAPYFGAIGGGESYIFYKAPFFNSDYAVQFKYYTSEPIWLTEPLSFKADGVYRVTPTGLGYVVHYEIDITDYESW